METNISLFRYQIESFALVLYRFLGAGSKCCILIAINQKMYFIFHKLWAKGAKALSFWQLLVSTHFNHEFMGR